MRTLRRFAIALIVALGAAALTAIWYNQAVNGPGPLTAPTTVIIAPATGLAAIAHQLAGANVVSRGWLLAVEARRTGLARVLKPGEYRFDPATSIAMVLRKLARHDVVLRYLTVPEGLVTADVLDIIDHAEGLQGALPAVNGEGLLLPETYRYEWGDRRAAMVARMRAARDAMLAALWPNRASDLPLATPDEAIILASIVEKETARPDERPRVAAVYLNRLRRGMRLQADPTVIYGLGHDGKQEELTRADLEHPSPYNTYLNPGLPPGPICNPGRASVIAVLHPSESQDLYFVADGSGGHVFAASLEQHNRNVAQWRHWQQKGREDRRSDVPDTGR